MVMQDNLKPELKESIRKAFIDMTDKEVLKSFRVQAFAPTNDQAYDVLRDTAAILKLDIGKMK
jgi:phosphonate transport system substrate-binding protein